jgi:hypothetical protein
MAFPVPTAMAVDGHCMRTGTDHIGDIQRTSSAAHEVHSREPLSMTVGMNAYLNVSDSGVSVSPWPSKDTSAKGLKALHRVSFNGCQKHVLTCGQHAEFVVSLESSTYTAFIETEIARLYLKPQKNSLK